uniref:Peptidase_M14 domain-containing protein n=1 Tax=Globodera pallida TaxID=36090 RepID=A0A183BW90_GLOPA
MSAINIVLLCFFIHCATLSASKSQHFEYYDGFQIIRVALKSDENSAAMENFSSKFDSKSVQLWNFRPDFKESADIFVGPEKIDEVLAFLKNNGIEHHTVDSNYGILLREHFGNLTYEEIETIEKESDFNLNKFQPFDMIVKYLQFLAENYTEFVKLGSLGKTFEGRDQPIITLGYKNGSSQKPSLLVDAGIHAREWIAPATALHFINAFVNDPDMHDLLHEIDVHIVPVLNADGYVYTWKKNRLWRKTRSGPRKADPEICSAKDIAEYEDEEHNCFGTDGNRNFPYKWGISGTNGCPCGETFRGDSALSEPETRNLAQFVRSHNTTLKAWWILHTFSAWIAYDNRSNKENVEQLKRVAHAMAEAIANSGKDKYKYKVHEVNYLCPGCSLDFGRTQDIKLMFFTELTNGYYNDKYYGFVFPEESINNVAKSIIPALRILADEVRKEKGEGLENKFC